MSQRKDRPCNLDLFKEMCDLIFEIAEMDDDSKQSKARYLNSHNAKWIQSKEPKKEDSNSNSKVKLKEPVTTFRGSYRCALPMTSGHIQFCEGFQATCRYCGIKGHIKDACGRRDFFPGPTLTRNSNSTSTTGPLCKRMKPMEQ